MEISNIRQVLLHVNDLDKLKKREGALFDLLLNGTMRYVIQGECDADQIVSELKEDGFDLLQASCACRVPTPGCNSCYSSMQHEEIVYNFIVDFLQNLSMGPTLREAIGEMSVRGGAYSVEAKLFDPRTVMLYME